MYVGRYIGKCPIYGGIFYSEWPLSEVPLFVNFSKNASSGLNSLGPKFSVNFTPFLKMTLRFRASVHWSSGFTTLDS